MIDLTQEQRSLSQDGQGHEADVDSSEEDSDAPPVKKPHLGKRAALPKHATQILRLWLFSHTAVSDGEKLS